MLRECLSCANPRTNIPSHRYFAPQWLPVLQNIVMQQKGLLPCPHWLFHLWLSNELKLVLVSSSHIPYNSHTYLHRQRLYGLKEAYIQLRRRCTSRWIQNQHTSMGKFEDKIHHPLWFFSGRSIALWPEDLLFDGSNPFPLIGTLWLLLSSLKFTRWTEMMNPGRLYFILF